MNWKTLALCSAVAGSLVGCGDGGGGGGSDSGMGTDAGGGGMPPVSQTYIISQISIPSMPSGSEMNIAPGFNLDGRVTPNPPPSSPMTCEDAFSDFISPTGEMGVDNQFTGMLASLLSSLGDVNVQMTVDEQIASGSLLLALTVSDINSFMNDSSVMLELALVKPMGCSMETCPPMGGSVMANQMWERRTVIQSGVTARIENGQLRGMVDSLPLMISVGDRMIALTVRSATIGGQISMSGFTNAAIGGALRISDIVATLRSIPDFASFAETAMSLLPTYADIEPGSDPMECQAISIGIGLTGVPGTVSSS